jgi:serine/threonine protein kinase/tetratricopeptide (TPR) repeat protein
MGESPREDPSPAAAGPANRIPEQAPAAGPKGTVIVNFPVTEQPGDRLGRYKLLQQIGEGGCGVVYMAEQEEPVRRRVALKVIKLGMDTKSVIARFEAERQALALMDHPNIAKVLDAGATDAGRSFFVMELVRGIKITEYCDQYKLSTEERLKLFVQVCQAIQHAHQKGIIHRDIKPSNILVTLHDGIPVPKVIDFGIAKATQGRLTDQTLFTAFEQFIGTPAYMSPEQAEMSGLDVDTRSDIYALGVLLYELLTGKTPFDAKELLASGLDRLRQAIREREPERPSTRLRTMLQEDLTTTAARRKTDPPRLIYLVRGDLDWIVMKTLEKDRTRRYETANGLAMDVRRHLNNEPVLARPPSNLYRLHKLVRRNKAAVIAVSAVCLALLIGFGLSLYLFIQEREARRRAIAAEQEQARLRKQAEDALTVQERMRDRAELADKLSAAGRLVSDGRFDEAEQIFYQIHDPSTAPLLNSLAMTRARNGDWPRAITNFSRLMILVPTEPMTYYHLAPLLVHTGAREAYEQHRQNILRQFFDARVPITVQRMLKACLLLPLPDSGLEGMDKLGKALETAGPRLLAQDGFRVARGLLAYREGEYAWAVELLKGVGTTPQASNPQFSIQACLISSMAQWQLGRKDEARVTLSKCQVSPEEKSAKLKVKDFGSGWNEYLVSEALRKEATALFEEDQSVHTGQ